MVVDKIEVEGIKLINFIKLNYKEKKEVLVWRNHPEVRKWSYNDKKISLEEHLKFIEDLKNDTKRMFFLVEKERKKIGVVSLNRIDYINKNAFMGIYANIDLQIRGRGDILMKALLNLSFRVLKLHTLKLEVFENNERAIKLYKKFKFSEEGRLKEFVFRNKRWIDVIIMGRINNGDI